MMNAWHDHKIDIVSAQIAQRKSRTHGKPGRVARNSDELEPRMPRAELKLFGDGFGDFGEEATGVHQHRSWRIFDLRRNVDTAIQPDLHRHTAHDGQRRTAI